MDEEDKIFGSVKEFTDYVDTITEQTEVTQSILEDKTRAERRRIERMFKKVMKKGGI